MTTTEVQSDNIFDVDNEYFNEELHKVVGSLLPKFDSMVKAPAFVDILFAALIAGESLLFAIFFNLLVATSAFAFGIALFFLTVFSYFMLRQYMQARKPEQRQEFKDCFLRGCRQLLRFREGIPEHHLTLAHACCRLATAMEGRENSYFRPPAWLGGIAASIEKASSHYFRGDLYRIRELLLECAVEEHIALVRCEPTNLDAHAALANAYVVLSGLYVAFRKKNEEGGSLEEEMEAKFRATAEKAIEEFKILNAYAPNDPWVHTQLAYSYRDLKMPLEEIKEYEVLLKLRPGDQQTLFKLGRLYFQQGMNAKGLRVYELLKQANYKRAEELIAFYGSTQ